MQYISKAKRLILQICIIVLNRTFIAFNKIRENRVLFLSDVRSDIGTGNLYYLYKFLPDSYEKVTSFKPDRRNKRSLKEFIKLIYNLSVSKVILLDDFCAETSYLKVRKNQELVQLWHGAGAFKKFGHSRAKENGDLNNITVHPGYKRYTKAIVSADNIRKCYAEAFNISLDKVNATGFPRTDLFFNKNLMDEKKQNIYKKYSFLKKRKVILFAPTYRGTKVSEAYYDLDMIDFEKIYNIFNNEYVFIIKWHPAYYNNILNKSKLGPDLSKYKDFYYDFSNERDINDLLLVSDILITDYSSVIFDWAFLNKPIIYFTYDLDEYSNGRGLYFPFNDYVYGNIAKSSDELIKYIESADLCKNKRKIFFNKFLGACDGKSTEKTYKWIFNDK